MPRLVEEVGMVEKVVGVGVGVVVVAVVAPRARA